MNKTSVERARASLAGKVLLGYRGDQAESRQARTATAKIGSVKTERSPSKRPPPKT
jgi:hypothetical protein